MTITPWRATIHVQTVTTHSPTSDEEPRPDPPETPGTPGTPGTPSPTRLWARRGLLTLATVVGIVAVLAVWANRQVLDSDNWATTSTALLQNDAIRTQLSEYLVDQVYANVNVAGELRQALPPRLAPLAGPAAGGLRDLAQKVAFELLGRPRVQEAWKAANRITAREFVNIVEGRSRVVTLNGNAVFVDLRPILGDLTQRLGLPASVSQAIPAGVGQIKVMTSDQISTVQSAVKLVRGLAIVLPALALVLFALAVFISEGRRRHTLLFVGFDGVLAGIVVLVAVNVAGHAIVNSLAASDSVKPATQAAWSIASAMLKTIAQSTIFIGLAIMLAAALAGPKRPARAFRRAAAPWFRERPGVTYGVVLALLALLVLWGPIQALRMPIPVLVAIVLLWLGTEALRRQTAAEYPDAQIGDTVARLRARFARGRGSGAAPATAPTAATPAAPATPSAPSAPPPPIAGASESASVAEQRDRIGRLRELLALRDAGALTEREFLAEKAVLLKADEATP